MSLNIVNQAHYDTIVARAKELGLMPELQKQLDYLSTYADHGRYGEVRCNLGYDFAPLSFSFTMQHKKDGTHWKDWFVGGLIFHPGATGPDRSFSCELIGSDKPHWSVHT